MGISALPEAELSETPPELALVLMGRKSVHGRFKQTAHDPTKPAKFPPKTDYWS